LNQSASWDDAVLVDTNLAILLCVGLCGRENIAKHPRLKSVYDSNDFDLLYDALSRAKGLVFSPYVLSETSNLVRQKIHNPLKNRLSEMLKSLIQAGSEIQIECMKIVEDSDYLRLGLTDAALLSILEKHPNLLLLTVDLDLYLAAASRGHHVRNFSHIRAQRPDFQ
jgi:predicted nucleic acid-binding protein